MIRRKNGKKLVLGITLLGMLTSYQASAVDFNFNLFMSQNLSDLMPEKIQIKHVLMAVGTIGAIIGTVKLINYLRWTDKKTTRWIKENLKSITEASAEFSQATDKQSILDIATRIGASSPSWDNTLRAAAPLHYAEDIIVNDLATLRSVMTECIKRHFFNETFIDESLRLTRVLLPVLKTIRDSAEYRTEIVEIERIKNSRRQLDMQQQNLIYQSEIAHNTSRI